MYVTQGEYKGHALVQFWNSQDEASAGDKKPVMAMGFRKAKIAVEGMESLKLFVQGQEALKGALENAKPSIAPVLPQSAPTIPTLPGL